MTFPWRARMAAATGVVLVVCALLDSGASAAAPVDEDTVTAVAAQLRCVVCQNLSVADSPSETARQMRDIVRERLALGETPEQVMAYFVDKYGTWILLAPPAPGLHPAGVGGALRRAPARVSAWWRWSCDGGPSGAGAPAAPGSAIDPDTRPGSDGKWRRSTSERRRPRPRMTSVQILAIVPSPCPRWPWCCGRSWPGLAGR